MYRELSQIMTSSSLRPGREFVISFFVDSQAALRRVLVAVLVKAPRPTDYCQGMNYIAALFLVVFNGNEVEAAECLYHFFFTKSTVLKFEDGFFRTTILCQNLNQFVKLRCPRLYQNLLHTNLQLEAFTFSWMLLGFVYDIHTHWELLDIIRPLWVS